MSPPCRPFVSLTRRHPIVFELLEPRQLFAITLDANGFSQFNPAGKNVVFVSSSSGNDNNNGSQSAPLATIGKAKQMLNDGSADWVLLKRGDIWHEANITLTRSGATADDPILFGAYGTGDRPIIDTGTGTGIQTFGSGGAVNNFAIVGIHFIASGYNGTNGGFETCGIRLLKQGDGILIEDCMVEGFKDNITIQGDGSGISNITLRRSVVVDAFNGSGSVGNGHAQGIYVSPTTNGMLIEENVFDHNGWKEGVAAPTVFDHDMYIQTGAQNITVRGNIVSRASENGVLLRGGGTIEDNLFIRDAVGAIVSNTNSVMTGNVVLEGTDLPDLPQGIGLNSVKLPGLLIDNNIIAHDTSNFSTNVAAIAMQWGISSAQVSNNIIFDWRHAVSSGGANASIDNNQITEFDTNHFIIDQRDSGSYTYLNNIYSSPAAAPFHQVSSSMSFSQWQGQVEPSAQNVQLNYLDPWRDVGEYGATLTPPLDGTFEGWIAAARANNSQNWNAALMAQPAEEYIRQGFQILDPNDPNGSNGKIIVNAFATDPNAVEGGNNGVYTLTRTGPTTSPLTVTYNMTGSATPLVDYSIPKLSYTFAVGEAVSKPINLVAFLDGEVEGTEFATLNVNPTSDPVNNPYIVGTRRSATVLIKDADTPDTVTGGGGGGGGTGGGGTPTGGGGTGGGVPGEPPISGDGLFGQYYNDESASGTPDYTRLDYQVNMDFGTSSPGGDIEPTTWSAQWTGQIEPEFGDATHPETYTFRMPANDGARLYINNQLVIDDWNTVHFPGDADESGTVDIKDFNTLAANFGKTGMTFNDGDFDGNGTVNILDFNILAANFGKTAPETSDTGSIPLAGDTKADIKIQFHNTAGPANIKLYWSSPDLAEEIVPHERLYSGMLSQPIDTTTQSLSTQSLSASSTQSTASTTPATRSGRRTIGTAFSSQPAIAPIDDTNHALALAELV